MFSRLRRLRSNLDKWTLKIYLGERWSLLLVIVGAAVMLAILTAHAADGQKQGVPFAECGPG